MDILDTLKGLFAPSNQQPQNWANLFGGGPRQQQPRVEMGGGGSFAPDPQQSNQTPDMYLSALLNAKQNPPQSMPSAQPSGDEPDMPGMPDEPEGLQIPQGQPIQSEQGPVQAQPGYDVQRGDNMWNIARSQLGNGANNQQIQALVNQLVARNGIKDPNMLSVGQHLNL